MASPPPDGKRCQRPQCGWQRHDERGWPDTYVATARVMHYRISPSPPPTPSMSGPDARRQPGTLVSRHRRLNGTGRLSNRLTATPATSSRRLGTTRRAAFLATTPTRQQCERCRTNLDPRHRDDTVHSSVTLCLGNLENLSSRTRRTQRHRQRLAPSHVNAGSTSLDGGLATTHERRLGNDPTSSQHERCVSRPRPRPEIAAVQSSGTGPSRQP